MDVSKVRQQLARRIRERKREEEALLATRGKMKEGCLLERYTECRKGNCKCTRGEPHGPFLYWSRYVKGRLRHTYVGKKEDQKVVEGLKRYRVFQTRLKRIRAIGGEMNTLWNTYRKAFFKP